MYARAPSDTEHKVYLRYPCQADGSFTAPGKVVLIVNARKGAPDAGYRWEYPKTATLIEWGWRQLKLKASAFILNALEAATTLDYSLAPKTLYSSRPAGPSWSRSASHCRTSRNHNLRECAKTCCRVNCEGKWIRTQIRSNARTLCTMPWWHEALQPITNSTHRRS